MKRATVHVTPRSRGKWAVKVEGNSRASATYTTKKKAVKKGRKKAKKLKRKVGKSELKIHDSSGRIQKSRSYGSDPRRFPG